MKQFEIVTATFQPRRRDDLKPRAVLWVGVRMHWQAAWVVEREDGGPYIGHWAMVPIDPTPKGREALGWVPLCDLVGVNVEQGDQSSAEQITPEGLAAMHRDAERYRWLREQCWFSGPLAVVTRPKESIRLGFDAPFRERLDAAIDEARLGVVPTPQQQLSHEARLGIPALQQPVPAPCEAVRDGGRMRCRPCDASWDVSGPAPHSVCGAYRK